MDLSKDVFKRTLEESNTLNKKTMNNSWKDLYSIMMKHSEISFFSAKAKEKYKNGEDKFEKVFIKKLNELIDTDNIKEEKDHKYVFNILLHRLSEYYSSLIEIENANYLKHSVLIMFWISMKNLMDGYKNIEDNIEKIQISEKNIDYYISSLKTIIEGLYNDDKKNGGIAINGGKETYVSIFATNEVIVKGLEILSNNNK